MHLVDWELGGGNAFDHYVFPRKPATAARFLEMGLDPGELGASAFQLYIASERDKLADIVRRAGIQPE